MKDMVMVKCINGYISVGDIVLSTVDDDYPCLVGRVFCIEPVGSPDRATENETDDVYVDFEGDYSDERIREIEKTFSGFFDEAKTIDDIDLDSVIMSPDCLIRITGIDDEKLDWICESETNAIIYGYRILRELVDNAGGKPVEQPGTRPVRGSYWTTVDGVRKEVTFENGLFHMWGSESAEYESGAVADTVAIVELPDGAVRTVYPNKLSFTRQAEG